MQIFASAGAGNAVAGVDLEKCAVCRTLDECGVVVEELVWLPVQFNAEMRAAVVVNIKLAVVPDSQQTDSANLEAAGGALG